jgi:hypothetical protein
MSDSLQLPKGSTGGSTTTPADVDAALASATPVIVSGGLTDPRAGVGDMSSRGSTKRPIGRGVGNAPPPAPPDDVHLPQKLAGYARWLYEHDAVEVIVFAGGAELVVGKQRIELNPGRWIVVQVDDALGGLPANVAFGVPKFCPSTVRHAHGSGEGGAT